MKLSHNKEKMQTKEDSMLDYIPVSAIIAVVVIAAIVVFLAVGYVKAPTRDMAFIVSGIKKKQRLSSERLRSGFRFLNVWIS